VRCVPSLISLPFIVLSRVGSGAEPQADALGRVVLSAVRSFGHVPRACACRPGDQ
jgi:hypothetical protein